jgi:hypothetical protein
MEVRQMRNAVLAVALALFVSSQAWASFGYWVVAGYGENKRRIAGPFNSVLVCDQYAKKIEREMNLDNVRCEFLVD